MALPLPFNKIPKLIYDHLYTYFCAKRTKPLQNKLPKNDIILIVTYLITLINAKAVVDDIDHLSNRRVRTVGEQLFSLYGVGLARMARTIKERMNVRDNEDFKPVDLINARTLTSVINSFFNPISGFTSCL